ncbi:hypothetical protein [Chromobacterium sphagni]|uniref:hypothetical protein n=1 Tax=Chromobacterium sphagni TaxID=1903179 RepID=UPI0011133310|nr:hypothetical protein [Chromobacterium sphagni]
MKQAPTRGGDQPLILSDKQGFDRRWFAPQLQAVYVPTRHEQAEEYVGAALSEYGRDMKIASGRHCYENFVYNHSTRAIIDMSAMNQAGFDAERNAYFVDAGCENWACTAPCSMAMAKPCRPAPVIQSGLAGISPAAVTACCPACMA